MVPKCLHVLVTLAQWWYCFQRKSNSVQEDHQSATVPDLLLIMHWYVEAWDWLFPLYPQLWLWAEGLLLLCTWWISVLMFHHEHFFSRSIDASWWSHCTLDCTTRGQSSAWFYHGVQEVELNPSLLFHCTVLPWFSQFLVVFHIVEIYIADSSCWAEMSNMAISAFGGQVGLITYSTVCM